MTEQLDMEARIRSKLKGMFLAVRDECVAGLELAADVRDVDQASFWAHKMISSMNTMGHTDVASQCIAVETEVEEGASWDAISGPVVQLIASCRAIE